MRKPDCLFFHSSVRHVRASFGVVKTVVRISSVVAVSGLFVLGSLSYSQGTRISSASKTVASNTARTARPNGEHKTSEAASKPGTSTEVEQLRSEVGQLRAEIERLRSLVDAAVKKPSSGTSEATQVAM